MTIKTLINQFIKIVVLVSIFIFILSSCDIIDSIIDGNETVELNEKQEQALTTVLTLQDYASDIMGNLFTSGMDTMTVIDSLANFFMSDTSIQNVWADSEGVEVDYKNGISGGIFVGRYNPIEMYGPPPDTLISVLSDDDLQKPFYKYNSVVPTVKKSIIFDGAYPQFKVSADLIINAANSGFSKVGIEPFTQHLDSNATIEVLSTLDQYGIIHIAGHGWRKRKSDGFAEDKVTYLLTGEKAELNKTYGELWNDILEKNVIIVKYGHKKENRYWVSPKFVSDRNDFHNKNVFIYSGICSGARGGWMKEMVKNAGAKIMVAYKYSVKSNWEEFWVIKVYNRMCDIELDKPLKIGDCINTIINEPYGYHYFRNFKAVHMVTYNTAGRDLTFWETDVLNGKVEYFLDIAEFKRTNDASPFTANLEEVLYLNDVNGIFSNNVFNGNYSYQSLGRTFSGNVEITFIDNPESINIHLDNTMSYQSNFGFGTVTFYYTVDYNGIPYEGVDNNSGQYKYSESGSSVSKINITWQETNSQYTQDLISYTCGDNAYITVAVDKRE